MTTIEMYGARVRAEALKVQLAARFRKVPADVEALVDSATSEQLLNWMTIAANADTLDQVFPGHGD